ncbi:hypothetical protein NOE36_22225 [Escherichia coli]|uniref:hypothetical protein n=1 Tax=Escherichia coli TaxID=562 RepID=UPI002101C732|nr:hypothetical protein [Escherichia coli]MCQ1591430.1 hypothetical protein [Escherichia coli]MCQ1597567.1 hypothetical protein [Escherichia coli]
MSGGVVAWIVWRDKVEQNRGGYMKLGGMWDVGCGMWDVGCGMWAVIVSPVTL